ncbi:unnamed protein product [Cylindrotheca closterium]|uniref:DUF6824 domain-containing protein n=1 Tax=Cylindrotheca closterium TaxID=2856 RepID=A0AAD2GDI9_9STRA|nr:unnamed protein product [Cylindrotheca closterium]
MRVDLTQTPTKSTTYCTSASDMGDELDRKIDARDSVALKERSTRVLKPGKLDVLCGRGAPIQSHEGNVRMREIVSKYAQRYMEARKYRKQLIAEEALMVLKNTDDKSPVRFLRKVDRQDYWEEVDDKAASEKVQHTLRSFVRKMEGGSGASIASEGSGSLNDGVEKRRASLDSLSQSHSLPARRTSPLDAYATHGSSPLIHKSSLLASGLTRAMAPRYYGVPPAATSQSAAEAELQHRLALRQMSTGDLIRVVAAERAERQALALENRALGAYVAPAARFGQLDYQQMPAPAANLAVQVAGVTETASAEGERKSRGHRSQQDEENPKSSKQ